MDLGRTADQSVVVALHDAHARALWGYVLRMTGDRGRAEDVVQETLLRAWRHPEVIERGSEATRAWLLRVARNLVVDEWRSARWNREVSTGEPPEEVDADRVDGLLQSWLVADALARLSPDHRAVLVETYYRGRSTAEASRSLGVPEGTVKSRSHYALKALRLTLQEMGVVS